mmetsp:Transcript_5831/g.12744  ORF Transcript_5831/g.12744 Transcript_5831/m.12744 type:complete len:203 (+) Transcript_5831:2514-3122(+)
MRKAHIGLDSQIASIQPCLTKTSTHSSGRHVRCCRNEVAYSMSRCLAVRCAAAERVLYASESRPLGIGLVEEPAVCPASCVSSFCSRSFVRPNAVVCSASMLCNASSQLLSTDSSKASESATYFRSSQAFSACVASRCNAASTSLFSRSTSTVMSFSCVSLALSCLSRDCNSNLCAFIAASCCPTVLLTLASRRLPKVSFFS